jgi:hypothetical protein
MTLDNIKEMISNDICIDKTELDIEAINTPQLHNKYLIMLLDEKMILSKYVNSRKILLRKKWLYYTGKMSEDELKIENWEPFSLNLLKSDIDKFMESDDEMIISNTKVVFQTEKVNYLESVVKMITNRQWLIREAIDWIKFTNGT